MNNIIKDIKEWLDKHKYKPFFSVELINIIEHNGYECGKVSQHVVLYKNGFGQRKAKILSHNYNTEPFSGKPKDHPYWKTYIKPWLDGKNVVFKKN